MFIYTHVRSASVTTQLRSFICTTGLTDGSAENSSTALLVFSFSFLNWIYIASFEIISSIRFKITSLKRNDFFNITVFIHSVHHSAPKQQNLKLCIYCYKMWFLSLLFINSVSHISNCFSLVGRLSQSCSVWHQPCRSTRGELHTVNSAVIIPDICKLYIAGQKNVRMLLLWCALLV